MTSFTRDDLTRLAGVVAPACVSIYIPPRRSGAVPRVDATRVRNLARTARIALAERGVDMLLADAVIRPVETLAGQRELWRDPEHGVAIFSAPGLLQTFRIPIGITERVRVDTCFDLLPLVELVVDDGTFYILSLDRGAVRLFRATRQDLAEISLGAMPVSFETYLDSLTHERHPQMHSGSSARAGDGAGHQKEGTIFHDTSSRRTRGKKELEGFLRNLDKGVAAVVGAHGEPLVLAGVGAARAMYRHVSAITSIVPEGIGASLSPGLLHSLAWRVAAPFVLRGRDAVVDRLLRNAAAPIASFDERVILERSRTGDVGTLFLRLKERERREEPTYGVDAVGRSVNNVLRTSGDVCIVHDALPHDADVAALFRY